jgi:nucleotide-binding universal stress UspA family protein
MSFKDILVHLDDGRAREERIAIACELARLQQAHLVGLYVVEPVSLGGYRMPVAEDAPIDFEELRIAQARLQAAATTAGQRAEAAFLAAAERAGITSECRHAEGDVADVVALHARYADLAVLGQIDPEARPPGSAAHLPESILLGSGRPILMVPYVGHFETVGKNVLVAWNATREAARAVGDALPLLKGADVVTVLSLNPERGIAGEGNLPAADIAHHLARHDVKAVASYTVAEDIDVGNLLLSRAADLGSDLIVMGGYGHSRTRELILGGATRTILENMTVPVLMSH